MTQIPDSLKKLRDHKSEIFWKNINENADTLHARTIFKHGFDAACAELLPVIEEMRQALLAIHGQLDFEMERDEATQGMCDPFPPTTKALAAADKILGEK